MFCCYFALKNKKRKKKTFFLHKNYFRIVLVRIFAKERLTRKTLCLPKDHRQSIEKEVKIYNPSELSSKLLYL